MPEQGNLFTTRDDKTPALAPVPRALPPRIPAWLIGVELTLFVILRLYVGALVVLLPWRSLWTTNAWINYWPAVANFLAQGWVRGLVSGLGLLNIWIACSALFRRKRNH
jgi:hypothetical protein